MDEDSGRLQELVAEVAAAYFSNSHVTAADIPNVIQQIAASLSQVGTPSSAGTSVSSPNEANAQTPALAKPSRGQIQRSITPEALVSFEDGRGYKTLKRHLSVRGLTPQQYREKWGLPVDYPMTAPAYSELRSQTAKALGLGQRTGRRRAPPAKGRAKATQGD